MATGWWPFEVAMTTMEPYGAVPDGVDPRMAPAGAESLYCWLAGGHTPTRCRAWSALMASLQLENVPRSGKFTGGGPSDTTTLMTSPSLAMTGGLWAGAEAGRSEE